MKTLTMSIVFVLGLGLTACVSEEATSTSPAKEPAKAGKPAAAGMKTVALKLAKEP